MHGATMKVTKVHLDILKFVRSYAFYKLLQRCPSIQVYIFYISYMCLLVIIYFFSLVPKIVKTGSYLLEYSPTWRTYVLSHVF